MAESLSLPKLTAELAQLKKGDPVDCIKRSLRAAIKLEFATIPPYLTAMWSIPERDPMGMGPDPDPDRVTETIKEIVVEEMLHMGLVCNMLVGLSEPVVLAAPASVPTYPGPLPGDVNPELVITLRRLTPSQLKVFMDIEYPEGGPITAEAAHTFETIGEFYAALLKALETVDPFPLDVTKQRDEMLPSNVHLFHIQNVSDARRAIDLIRRQGEGSRCSPEEMDGHLAHFYQFREVYVGARYVPDAQSKQWGHTGPPVAMPSVWPMADIPAGGYQKVDVPYPDVWATIEDFDKTFTAMLRQLEEVWRDPRVNFRNAIISMFSLGDFARKLIKDIHQQRPDRRGTYGPCFRLTP